MIDQHLLTPPPELVEQWLSVFYGSETLPGWAPREMALRLATQAARWGADQELEACCEHLKRSMSPRATVDYLRAARRPKPPSLKEQALDRCNDYIDPDGIIRRALEQLND